MKRSITFLLLFCMAMVFTSSVAMAGTAPRLTNVKIDAFTASNYGYQWKLTPASYPKNMSAYSFSGTELYMDVVYTGYPNWNLTFIKVNGSQYTHSQLFYSQYNITSGGVIAGYEVLYKIPASYLNSSNNITVQSYGTNGGSASDASTYVNFAK